MARPGFLRHRKFARLARLLGSKPLALGSIEMVWDVAYENGDPDVGSAEDVEYAADWAGEPGKLAGALAESGLLDRVTDDDARVRYLVHDLEDHAPEYVGTRKEKEGERRKVKVCEGCGREFHSPDRRAKHCSAACRQRAYRDRVADADAGVTETPSRVTDRYGPPAPAPAPAPAPGSLASLAGGRARPKPKLGPLGAAAVAQVGRGLRKPIRPAASQAAADEFEARIRWLGGVEAAVEYFARACRQRDTEPEGVGLLLDWLRDLGPPARELEVDV